TARDIPGVNCIALIERDQPCLADGRINHPEEPVVLLAHPDRFLLEEARRHVTVHVEAELPVLTIDDSLSARQVIWGQDNVFKRYLVQCGDAGAAMAWAAQVVEDEDEPGAREQLYIEPNGMIATADPLEGVTIRGSMQCPYYIHAALAVLFDLPADRIRIVQMET